jgi:hypothetical protein
LPKDFFAFVCAEEKKKFEKELIMLNMMLDTCLVKSEMFEYLAGWITKLRERQIDWQIQFMVEQTEGQMNEQADRQMNVQTDREMRMTDRQRQTETDRDRQRQTETDRDRQRQTETDRRTHVWSDRDKNGQKSRKTRIRRAETGGIIGKTDR